MASLRGSGYLPNEMNQNEWGKRMLWSESYYGKAFVGLASQPLRALHFPTVVGYLYIFWDLLYDNLSSA